MSHSAADLPLQGGGRYLFSGSGEVAGDQLTHFYPRFEGQARCSRGQAMALLAAMDDAMCVPQTLHEPAGTHSFGMHARRVGRAQKCVLQYKTAAYWTYLMTLCARPHA